MATLGRVDGAPYRPSNGTEGAIFERAWCARCKHEPDYEPGGKDCMIQFHAFWNDIGDEDYPKEWIWKRERPVCTAFEEKS